MRILTALPVYNEVRHVTNVLNEVTRYASDVLVVTMVPEMELPNCLNNGQTSPW